MTQIPDPFSQIFIDGANLWHCCAAHSLNINLDYNKLGAWLMMNFNATRINYYTAVQTDSDGHQSLRKLLDWLSYNGYNVVEKPAKYRGLDKDDKPQYKGNMDIEIAMDCARLMHNTSIRRAVLMTGDADFEPVVRYMQDYGTHVTIISTRKGNTPVLSEQLRKVADAYIDVDDLREILEKDKE